MPLRPADFVRTVVLGNGGSGKSWLAERLAGIAGAAATDMDLIHWVPGGYNVRRDPAVAISMVREVAAGDRWILEGVYGWLAQEALPRATALVLLDIPDDECVANVKARGLRRGGDEAAFAELIQWVSEYRIRRNANSFAAHEAMFERFQGTKCRLKSREDVGATLVPLGG
ncbi:MAG: adenylate kinase [Planctomycetes bacterium]|nr:adenylate kinase [Planctomycetota bacterium]